MRVAGEQSTTETAGPGGHDAGAGDALEFAAFVDEMTEQVDAAETLENLAAAGWALVRAAAPATPEGGETNE